MKERSSIKIRELLRSDKYREDGLTRDSISILTGIKPCTIGKALDSMPDAYVYKWADRRPGVPGRSAQIWRVVIPPPNCPPPAKKNKVR